MRKPVLIVIAAAITLLSTSAALPVAAREARLGAPDFLKADGNVLRTNSGSGPTMNLRGTNVGGWLAQEDWMSPLGEFAVDRTGWSVTASAGTPTNTIDGSQTTRWTTNATQDGTEWLSLDLGAATFFNRVSIDNSVDAGQYPRKLDVETSTDGATWVSVANQSGFDGLTTLNFSLQEARHLRLRQTATANARWSVGEINLFNDPTMHNDTFTARASSSASDTPPSMGVDGNASTVWQSGVAQVPGQSFTIDLGRDAQMDKILVDSGSATANDYPRSWEVFVSGDNVNFEHAASGYGSGRMIQADFQGWKWGRYLRIVSNGTADAMVVDR